MPDREIDGFKVWTSASQVGDSAYWGEITTKPLDDPMKEKIFRISTQKRLNSLREAQAAAADVLAAVKTIDAQGIPTPIIDPTID